MNEFLSEILNLSNRAIFCLVAIGAPIGFFEGDIEFFDGFLMVIGAAIACSFIATIMVIKEYLFSINSKIGYLNNIGKAIHSEITEAIDSES